MRWRWYVDGYWLRVSEWAPWGRFPSCQSWEPLWHLLKSYISLKWLLVVHECLYPVVYKLRIGILRSWLPVKAPGKKWYPVKVYWVIKCQLTLLSSWAAFDSCLFFTGIVLFITRFGVVFLREYNYLIPIDRCLNLYPLSIITWCKNLNSPWHKKCPDLKTVIL